MVRIRYGSIWMARWSSAEWLVLLRVYEGRHDHVDGRSEGRACGLPPPAAARWARGGRREGRQGTHGALQVGFTIHRHGGAFWTGRGRRHTRGRPMGVSMTSSGRVSSMSM